MTRRDFILPASEVFPPGSISDEVRAKLEIYASLLARWQNVKNLVGQSTIATMWKRHFLDSVQVLNCAPHARMWVDLGSGAGFPGLVTAILLHAERHAHVHLIESDHRKCAFLREVSRETGASTTIHAGRIEDILPQLSEKFDAVSARALAALPWLIEASSDLLLKGAIGVFPKGQYLDVELTKTPIDSRFLIEFVPSTTDPEARIAVVRKSGGDIAKI